MSTFQKVTKMAVHSSTALVCTLAMVGCGSTRHRHMREELAAAESFTAQSRLAPAAGTEPAPLVEPQAYATRFTIPAQCEVAARRLLPTSRDDAWTALKSCVEGTHFTLLGAVLGSAWAEELRTRPDAAQLLAQVVAQRGGSVEGDLRLLHARKVPIFGLTAAIAQPEVYKGRYLLLRAQVADVRSEGDKPTVWLVEQGLTSVASDQSVGYSTRKDSVSVRSGAVDGDVGMLGRANVGGQLSTSEREQRSTTVQRFDNVADDTGLEALGRLAQADPFFAPGKDFVVLARFDGMRVTSGGDADDDAAPKLPVLTIVSYYAPHPLVVY